ncbi:MAG: aminopeptidase [Acidobacteria bacterium]|nr:MAG: aminopeptidase [Acidobacteriota bacterium]
MGDHEVRGGHRDPDLRFHAPPLSAIDLHRLRRERLDRLQAAMRAHGADACLFFDSGNVRYATGSTLMTVYSMSASVRCALVSATGRPILFEHPQSIHVSRGVVEDVRPMRAWEWTDDPSAEAALWATEIAQALRELGVVSRRLFVDRLGTPAFLALAREGIEVVDSGPVTLDAREVKTPEEIRLMEYNAAIGMKMLAAFEAAMAPGVREQDLLAALTATLLREGGEYLITRACVSGPNTNPWNLEATDRALEPGDLVYVDTDAVGYEGYFIDVSRTFLCGDVKATPVQRAAYRAAYDWLTRATVLLKPGVTLGELASKMPRLPDRFLPQRYETMAHCAGLADEGPSIGYPQDPQPNGNRRLREGMIVCLEVYAGETGGRDGVKLEDQVLVTAEGARVMVPYPFCGALL